MKDLLDLMQLFAIAQTPEEQVETEEDYLRKGERIMTLQKCRTVQRKRVLDVVPLRTYKKKEGFKRLLYASDCISKGVLRSLDEEFLKDFKKWEDQLRKLLHPEVAAMLQIELLDRFSEEQKIVSYVCKKVEEEKRCGVRVLYKKDRMIGAPCVKVRKTQNGRRYRWRFGSSYYRVCDFSTCISTFLLVSQILYYLEGVRPEDREEDRVYTYLKEESMDCSIGELAQYLCDAAWHGTFLKMLLYEEEKRVSVIVDHVERLFYLVLKEYTQDLRTENFHKQLSSRAPVWKTKKNIPKQTLKAMKESGFNDFFGYVEFDEECELAKMEEIEKEFRQLSTQVFQKSRHEKEALRFRKLGNYHAGGLYFPDIHCLCVDIRQPQSMAHEYFHMLDYEAGSASRKQSFAECESLYEDLLRTELSQMSSESALRAQLMGKGKYNLDYYLEPTEIFARCGEIYLMRVLGIRSSLCRIEEGKSFAYPVSQELDEYIERFFKGFL